MKFEPISRWLFTDDDSPIKQLQCPMNRSWARMAPAGGARQCDTCNHLVHDTGPLSDDEVADLVAKQPEACLKVSLDQPNLRIVHRDARG